MTNIPHGQQGEMHHEAEHRDGRHRGDLYHFTGRDFNHWNRHEQTIWRGGVWRQEEYLGRIGYWWIVGGQRYFYERPVYPYPMVVPEIIYELPVDDQQQQDYSQQPPEDPYYWYYCEDPKGYYPYISECPSGWITVVPQPETPEE